MGGTLSGTALPQIEAYRPLLPLSLSVNVAVGDALGLERLASYHLGNILIHVGTCLLLYFFFSELLRLRPGLSSAGLPASHLSFLAVLLFAMHPVSGVPVNYICGRELEMMMFFMVASLWVYVHMRQRGDTIGGWILALGLLTLSLLAKQNSVVMPALVLSFDLLVARRPFSDRRVYGRFFAFGAVVAAFFVWTEVVLDFSDLGQLKTTSNTPWIYALTMARTHVFYYLRNVVWPFEMRALPRIDPAEAWTDPAVLLGAGVILASLCLAVALRKRLPLASWSILAYWLLFAPTSSIRPFRYLAADYRQYPSLAFLALASILVVFSLWRRSAVTALGLAFGIYFSFSTFAINRIWRTEGSLWAQSVRYGTEAQGHLNYGLSVAGRDPQLAEQHYNKSLELSPGNVYSLINLAMFEISQGRQAEGLATIREAANRSPDWSLTHYWLALAERQTGHEEQARMAAIRAAELDPRNPEYLYLAAHELQLAGQVPRSLDYLEKLHELRPGFRDADFLLGFALLGSGRFEEGLAASERAIEIDPDHLDARHNLGYAHRQLSNYEAAAEVFRQVLARDPSRVVTHYELASTNAESGQLEAARQTFGVLLQLDPDHQAALRGLERLESRDESSEH